MNQVAYQTVLGAAVKHADVILTLIVLCMMNMKTT
jgi:hypothetical protein